MLLIEAIVKPSLIHGMGLFAAEAIPKGMRIWQFSPGLDLEINPADFDALEQRERDVILFSGFRSKKTNQYHLSFDTVRFINHAKEGNVTLDMSVNDVAYPLIAAQDIQPGEELLQNYFEFDEAHQF